MTTRHKFEDRSWWAARAAVRRRLVAGLVGATLVAGALGSAAASASPQVTTAAPSPSVPWRDCGDGFQCATVKVPVDYGQPSGRQLDLALIRLPASDPAARIGSLFINPGGPGGSGVQTVRTGARLLYPPELRARFDIVGFDPRGVASSTPVRCFATSEEQQRFYAEYPGIPTTRAEFRRARAMVRDFAQRCQNTVGWLLPHLSTADVARDLDVLRARVGDRRLTYVGYSYGSYLGATYANLFPDHVRAMALDGVIDAPAYTDGPQPSTTFVRARSDRGSAGILAEFFRMCDEAGSRCAFGASGPSSATYAALAERLRARPLSQPDGSTFGYSDLVSLTVGALYRPFDWASLAEILQQLHAATTSSAAAAAIDRLRRLTARPGVPRPSGVQAANGVAAADDPPYDNQSEAATASYCSETANPRRLRDYQQVARAAERRNRYVGAYWTYSTLPCLAWPARAQDNFAGPWSARPSSPILLLSNRFDPATPRSGGVAMDGLLPRTRLLTVAGWGHTALLTRSACADGAVERYLIRLALPPTGATCETGVVPFVESPTAQRRLLPDGVLPGPLG